MYKKTLVKELILDGQCLLEALHRNRFPITGAFWVQSEGESSDWDLVIGSPVVDYSGPSIAYQRIQRVLASLKPSPTQLELSDIHAVGSASGEYLRLRMFAQGPGFFGGGAARGAPRNIVFQHAYIYD